jgi:hypothetical protein
MIWNSFLEINIKSNGFSSVDPKKTMVNIAVTVAIINNNPTIIPVFLYESIFLSPCNCDNKSIIL